MTKDFFMKNALLTELEQRGFIYQCSNLEGLNDALNAGPVTLYLGDDPTADSLHVGHMVPKMMMRWFKKFGHNPITLAGGATGRIGDPSDRDTGRPMMTEEVIAKNLAGLKKSAIKIIGDPNIIQVDNFDWHKNYSHLDFLREFGTDFTVPRMLSMESVKRRLETGMTFLEFNYMPLQAVDFYELYKRHNCVLQICGSDQWSNCLGGIDLIRKKTGAEAFVLSCPLITDSAGQKIGKSAGNAVWVNEDKTSPFEFYQYFRNVMDADVEKFLKLFTEIPLDEIAKLAKLQGAELNDVKKRLAFETTKMIHGEAAAIDAQKMAESLFSKDQGDLAPEKEIVFTPGMSLAELLMHSGLFESKSDLRRTIEQGGLSINDEKVTDINDSNELNIGDSYLIQKGKKTFLKVIIK